MYAKAMTHVGLVRKENEDNFLVYPERGIFAVADGMGGHVGGQIASSLAVQVLDRELAQVHFSLHPADLLHNALLRANDVIFQRGQEPQLHGMGTTLTAAVLYGERLFIAHIGDSRAYLCRQGKITQLTQDHSLVNELFQNGGITHAEAQNHPQRNILTRALGTQSAPLIDDFSLPVHPGDYLLLSTDGLHNHVQPEDLESILVQPNAPDDKLRQMVKMALARGGSDNVTVVLVKYE